MRSDLRDLRYSSSCFVPGSDPYDADDAQPLTTENEELDDLSVAHDLYDLEVICLDCETLVVGQKDVPDWPPGS